VFRLALPQREANHDISIRLARKPDTVGREVAKPQLLKLLSVQEAAGYAKVSPQTVRRWIKAGLLKIYRAGRQIRIDESDLLAYLCRPN
jgi:excisionase family DNA binding protein